MRLSKNELYDFMFCLLILSIPYSNKAPNIILMALGVFFLADYKAIKSLSFSRLKTWPLMIFLTFLAYFLLMGAVTGVLADNKYGLFPLLVAIPILALKITDFNRLLWAFLLSAVVLSVPAIYNLLSFYFKVEQLSLGEGTFINDLLGMERPYLGFLCVISVFSALRLASEYPRYKVALLSIAVYIALFVFFISARISVLTILAMTALYFIFYIKMSSIKRIGLVSVMLLIPALIILSSSNLRMRFFIGEDWASSVKALKRYEPRLITWDCAHDIAIDHNFNPIVGLTSYSVLDDKLIECYGTKMENKHRANFFIERKLNTHNQYICYYLLTGIIGLGLILLFFASGLICYRQDFTKVAMLVAIMFFFVVENVMNRQMGNYYFILLLAFVSLHPKKQNPVAPPQA
ncbi:hypothetical protein FLLO111716_03515 [Flavobacterium longum]|uniref:O-antigen ligase family protein n=1 Tax=Flavobacterium longum TaxID=1299340 RepID=UPI0039E84E3E